MRKTWTIPCMVAALLGIAAPVRGQVVRGQVVEGGSGAPVEGAMVVLMGFDGSVEHRVLTDRDGGFVARADRPGPHTIRVDRIGYESLTTDRFDVPVAGTFQRVEMPIRPVELVGLDVSGSRRCALRADQGRATAQVWEEARKALQAAAWTLSSGTYRYTLLNYERRLDPDGRPVEKDRRRFVRGTGQAPYVSLPAERLVDEGFIRKVDDGSLMYYAPDAEAFLSDAFLSTHCMRVEDVRDGLIGLGFEPVSGRRLPDISGTLWIDAASASLRRLEFTYLNRPQGHQVGAAGGQVSFGHLPNGTWVVNDWSLRMPLLATDAKRTRYVVTGYQVRGGSLWRVVDQQGTTVMEAVSATLSGTVVDSAGGPLPGAEVRLADASGGPPDAVTGEAGTYLVSGVSAGPQLLEVTVPWRAALGLPPSSFPVEAAAGEVTSTSLRIPGVGESLRGACVEPEANDGHTTTVLGRVTRGGIPAAGVGVRVRLFGPVAFPVQRAAAPPGGGDEGPTWALDDADPHWLTTTLDARGVFMMCSIPAGWRVQMEAPADAKPRTVKVLTIDRDDDVLVVTMELDDEKGATH